MAAKASQGVTTVITGNCGISLAPLTLRDMPPPPLDLIGAIEDYRYERFADYLAALDAEPAALNAACLVGHSTLRVGAMRDLDRPADRAELAAMGERLQEALDAGAIGLSSGLAYAPAAAAPAAEIEALARRLRPAGAIYTTHMRNEGAEVLDSLDESFAVGRAAGVPVVISHHKTIGRANFGRTAETLPVIAAAIGRQEVGLDAYPYIASSTVLSATQAERATKVLVTWSKSAPEEAGRELAAIAADWGVDAKTAVERLQPAGAIYWMMDEADVRRVLRFEHTMVGSDGLPHDTHPHPRLWGTFPRVLGHYCRELGLFALEEAVRRMTGLPADRFGLTGRGRLAEGAYADITRLRSGHGDRPRHLRDADDRPAPASSTSLSTAGRSGAKGSPAANAPGARCAANGCRRSRRLGFGTGLGRHQMPQELIGRGSPAEPHGMRATGLTGDRERRDDRPAQLPIERSGAAISDHVDRTGHREGGHRQPARRRFEEDEAEGFGPARQDEDIGRRVVADQLLAFAAAGKADCGIATTITVGNFRRRMAARLVSRSTAMMRSAALPLRRRPMPALYLRYVTIFR